MPELFIGNHEDGFKKIGHVEDVRIEKPETCDVQNMNHRGAQHVYKIKVTLTKITRYWPFRLFMRLANEHKWESGDSQNIRPEN